ncbi:MAG TPA: glycoside hydrolase family 57 protein [Rhodocyclaceae bacterium]|jgi:alpha-amylase/alpha-mannosidase (GH57 family)|nr:glycoside hydrolase family 57 protein [Rhodocyclaceae bacterium]
MQNIDLIFLWHMHQPDYRDHTADGEFVLPWVYLHAIKDYADMATHLELHPKVRAVVNFVPVLLEQIEDYADQCARSHWRDPLLRLLATPENTPLGNAERKHILEACFLANHEKMLAPFPDYQRLHTLSETLGTAKERDEGPDYFSDAYYFDLLVWYHLAWSGESARRSEPLLQTMIKKGRGFDRADRDALLEWIGRTLRELIPRYRALAERGQIELTATPQTHPLAPLLLDIAVGRETQPNAPQPTATAYPGGAERVERHIAAAQISHADRFGVAPVGMWPAEGAISSALVKQFAAAGVRWIASGEGVLGNSLHKAGMHVLHPAWQPWQLEGAPGLTMFFRDEHLSDLIGFEYSKWHSGDAAHHFVEQVKNTATLAPEDGRRPMVAVMLDGENAWEYYPYNGWYFFEELYGLLEKHTAIHTMTFSERLHAQQEEPAVLPVLVAGSWVYGTLSTWIGDPAKNRAWDLLIAAKQAYDTHIDALAPEQKIAAEKQLAVCESSDWFWWFGDYNPGPSVQSFDRLYRRNLANLYHRLLLKPPTELDTPISGGGGSAEGGGTMRRAS